MNYSETFIPAPGPEREIENKVRAYSCQAVVQTIGSGGSYQKFIAPRLVKERYKMFNSVPHKFVLKKFQRQHYDSLSALNKKSKMPFSCGFEERYDPYLMIKKDKDFQFFRDKIASALSGRSGVVLDCCSGSGIYLPILKEFADILIGIDLSHGLLHESKKMVKKVEYDNTFLIQSEAESIPLKSGVCDIIVMIDSLHHVELPDKVFNELNRVAKYDALLLLIEPNVLNPLVYLAHRIPKEERGATKRNSAKRLKRFLKNYIEDINILPLNYVASNKQSRLGKIIAKMVSVLFDRFFKFWPIRLLITGKFKKKELIS